jgi:uncharacterized protein (DUF2062 family)
MSVIDEDVQRLMAEPQGLTLLDGLLIGAVVGAAAATLVIVTRVVVTRRLARRLERRRALQGPAGEASPL